jgi:hypothetical protein
VKAMRDLAHRRRRLLRCACSSLLALGGLARPATGQGGLTLYETAALALDTAGEVPRDVALRGGQVFALAAGRWQVVRLHPASGAAPVRYGAGRKGMSCGRFVAPTDVAVSSDGTVAVWDQADHSITIFDVQGRCRDRFATGSLTRLFDMHFAGDDIAIQGVDADGWYREVTLSRSGQSHSTRAAALFVNGVPEDVETCGPFSDELIVALKGIASLGLKDTRVFHCSLAPNRSMLSVVFPSEDRTTIYVLDHTSDQVMQQELGFPLIFFGREENVLITIRQVLKSEIVLYEVGQ